MALDLGNIKIRIPDTSVEGIFECEIPWASLEMMLERYDAVAEERPGLTENRREFLRVTELVALWQSGREDRSDPFDQYRPTRYKRILRSVLRRRSDRREQR